MEFVFEEQILASPFVDKVWRTQSDYAGTFLSQASVNMEMVIWHENGQSGVTVRGPETTANIAETSANTEFFGIVFKLGVFMPHLPTSKLVDEAIHLPEAAGRSFWFNSRAWQLPEFNNADTFINRLARDGLLTADPVVMAALQGHEPDVSLRTLQYRFLHATGLTRKTLQQIERARQAAQLLEQGVSILDTVHDLGYFDQAHLTRSLKRFMGQTPTQIAIPRQTP